MIEQYHNFIIKKESKMFQKLQINDRIHVIAPSTSLSVIRVGQVGEESHHRAIKKLTNLGLNVTFGKHVYETGPFQTPSVVQRLEDLHNAFRNPEIKAIITVLGGWHGNQILHGIDYKLIETNPKIFCGYSDISVFHGAFQRKAGLNTWYGPHFSTFGMKHGLEYTIEYFVKALMSEESYEIKPSTYWADDEWFIDQEKRDFIENKGYIILQEGSAEGKIVGGNLCSLHLLQGTQYFPEIHEGILFFEDLRNIREFDRILQSVLQSPGGNTVRGLVIGRSPPKSNPNREWLEHMVQTKPELKGKPVIYGVDFGHTTPHTTFPLGGKTQIIAEKGNISIKIVR